MKKIILISIMLALGFSMSGQIIIHSDTAYVGLNDTIMWDWYHADFKDSDRDTTSQYMKCDIILKERFIHDDGVDTITYHATPVNREFILKEGDSIKNPFGSNYFQFEFVKNYIYTISPDMKYTLSKYFVLNKQDRLINP